MLSCVLNKKNEKKKIFERILFIVKNEELRRVKMFFKKKANKKFNYLY